MKLFWAAFALMAPLFAASAHAWPRIQGDTANPICRQANQLALEVFRSTAFETNPPLSTPPDLGSRFVVYRSTEDISGGGALTHDASIFSKIEPQREVGRPSILFWQTEPKDGRRLAVLDQPFNWMGDWYFTYLLDAAAKPEPLLHEPEAFAAAEGPAPVIDNSHWTPPLVLRDDRSSALWIIDAGEPYVAAPDWRIFVIEAGQARSPCTVALRPAVQAVTRLLPEPIRLWAASLDEALGSGKNEGTMQPTSRIRIRADRAWINAIMRPWAMTDEPYNTQVEVEAGLKQWASRSASRRALLLVLKRRQRNAEQALAARYTTVFRLPRAQAQQAARYVSDKMLRAYFVFPGEGRLSRGPSEPNPWPSTVR